MSDKYSDHFGPTSAQPDATVEKKSEVSKPVASSKRRDGKTLSIRSPVRIVQDKDNPGWTRPAEEEPISGDSNKST